MGGMWGNELRLSLFGESHGPGIGIVMDGLPSGLAIDTEQVAREMARRAPGRDRLSTARKEADAVQWISGVYRGRTTGTPLCALIQNGDAHSRDYDQLADLMRPGHADYTGHVRYRGYNDPRGGGHFSGRLTVPIVFAGAVCKQALAPHGVRVGAHIRNIAGIEDAALDPVRVDAALLAQLWEKEFPVLDDAQGEAMQQAILAAKRAGDSVGGIVECAVVGVPAGIGQPFFDSVESTLAHLLFAIPGVKGVQFGLGFAMAQRRGSACNDAYYYDETGAVKTRTNHSGGLLGGITSGMPIVFSVALRPTASIAKEQQTISLKGRCQAPLVVTGRHDPCIVKRALPVVEAMAAIAVYEQMKEAQACRI